MKGMFDGTSFTVLDIYQYPQAMLKNKMGKFNEEDIQKSDAWAQGKDDETVTIASR